jgi:hypothetical protein
MNANELANLLEVDSWYKLVTREEIATMLRQQQAEIGFYKQDADRYKLKCATQQVEIEAFKAKLNYMFEQEIKSARVNR